MDQLAAHQRAQDVFASVLANIRSDQLGDPSPCTDWTVKALIDHVIVGNNRVVLLAGGDPLPAPDDLSVAHAQTAAAAQAIFASAEGLTRLYELPIGTLPGSVFISLRTTDALAHAWDLARATGQPTGLDPELAAEMLSMARTLLTPELRGSGKPFRQEQPCPPGRPVADQLAAFLGRAVG
jgi:uncharacterized protein (TIGR03086 family)